MQYTQLNMQEGVRRGATIKNALTLMGKTGYEMHAHQTSTRSHELSSKPITAHRDKSTVHHPFSETNRAYGDKYFERDQAPVAPEVAVGVASQVGSHDPL